MNKQLLEKWEFLRQKTYKAHIADVDGNLTGTHENASNLSPLVISQIQKHLKNGIPFGICSARSFEDNPMLKSILAAVTNGLSNKEIKNFFIFPEQGASVLSFKFDKNKETIIKEIDLIKFFKIKGHQDLFNTFSRQELYEKITTTLQIANELKYKGDKKYGFIAQLNEKDLILDQAHQDKIFNLTHLMSDYVQKEFPLFEVLCTRKSIYVTLKGANKALAIRYFSKKYHLDLGEIVGTDDQGTKDGVGYPLICHKAGFSTNIYEEKEAFPFPVSPICNKTGVDAWLFIEKNLKYNSPIS